ncbi:hypothetical protein Lalb_Chr21g0305431 [Lupinus albus]|uniref:Uncharacterized protein n=1 Tax=Lupinus albus TaxID=3870 RepID=A0A6A4N3W1_LUPAL|nr:hypothetical protein Lalb_Chr21g0305431 [Lupinus albus]
MKHDGLKQMLPTIILILVCLFSFPSNKLYYGSSYRGFEQVYIWSKIFIFYLIHLYT